LELLPEAIGSGQQFKTLSPTPRDNCLTVPKSHMILPYQFLSEHVRVTVKTIDQSTVGKRGAFLEFQKAVKRY